MSSSVSYHIEDAGSDVDGAEVCLNTFGRPFAVLWALLADCCAVAIVPSTVAVQVLLTNTYNLLLSLVSYHNELAGTPEVVGCASCLNILGFVSTVDDKVCKLLAVAKVVSVVVWNTSLAKASERLIAVNVPLALL